MTTKLRRMTCPHGYNVNIKPHLVKRIYAEYHQSLKGGPLVLLHKLVYTDDECTALWKEAIAQKAAAPEKPPSSLLFMVPANRGRGATPGLWKNEVGEK